MDCSVGGLQPTCAIRRLDQRTRRSTHRGRQAYKRYLEQWLEGFDGMHIDVEEYIDVGGDRVFTWCRFTGRGRTSGAPADWYLAIIFTIRDGRVVRGEEYFDRAEALEAAGLAEQDAHADS